MNVPVGTIVVVEAPGSRASDGETHSIPAIVLAQHPDLSLRLYAFHFEGVPSLMNAVPLARVKVVSLAAEKNPLKFSLVSDESH